MSTGVITSFTLIDFPSESEMTAFFVFIEKHTDALANELRANGMIKFYVTRVFNKEGKFTVGNWLEYKDADSYKACEDIWVKFMTEKGSKSGLIMGFPVVRLQSSPIQFMVRLQLSLNLLLGCYRVRIFKFGFGFQNP